MYNQTVPFVPQSVPDKQYVWSWANTEVVELLFLFTNTPTSADLC
jgi:hypothetical protein